MMVLLLLQPKRRCGSCCCAAAAVATHSVLLRRELETPHSRATVAPTHHRLTFAPRPMPAVNCSAESEDGGGDDSFMPGYSFKMCDAHSGDGA